MLEAPGIGTFVLRKPLVPMPGVLGRKPLEELPGGNGRNPLEGTPGEPGMNVLEVAGSG